VDARRELLERALHLRVEVLFASMSTKEMSSWRLLLTPVVELGEQHGPLVLGAAMSRCR
jgi:hypothetical protein